MINDLVFREYQPDDEPSLLALNQSVVELTSPLDSQRLQLLLLQGCQITVADICGETAGVLMCFSDGSDYDSTNYQWFNRRIKQFMYIDRIIVSKSYRGQGAGQHFYQHLKQYSASEGCYWLAAEINSKPPNKQSLAFHLKQGFVEVGSQSLGEKTVSMQTCCLQGLCK